MMEQKCDDEEKENMAQGAMQALSHHQTQNQTRVNSVLSVHELQSYLVSDWFSSLVLAKRLVTVWQVSMCALA